MCSAMNMTSTRKLIAGNSFSVMEETVFVMDCAYLTVSLSLCSTSVSFSLRGPDSSLGVTLRLKFSFQMPKSTTPLSICPIHFNIFT